MLKPKSYSKSRDDKTVEYVALESGFNTLLTPLEMRGRPCLSEVGGPSILMNCGASTTMKTKHRSCGLKEGAVFFATPDAALTLDAGSERLLMYTVFVEQV